MQTSRRKGGGLMVYCGSGVGDTSPRLAVVWMGEARGATRGQRCRGRFLRYGGPHGREVQETVERGAAGWPRIGGTVQPYERQVAPTDKHACTYIHKETRRTSASRVGGQGFDWATRAKHPVSHSTAPLAIIVKASQPQPSANEQHSGMAVGECPTRPARDPSQQARHTFG